MARPLREEVDETDHQLARDGVRQLVAVSERDPLAPFALRPEKSYVFAPDGAAAVGFRVRVGLAVASGDPVGAAASWSAAIDEFIKEAQRRRLRVAVLGAGERARPMWQAYGFGHVAIGRDVVLHGGEFTLEGRSFRNLRQAIQRSRNSGVTVELHREGALRPELALELRGLMKRSQREDTRGFSMILGRLFDGSEPDAVIAVARDGEGSVVGAHRYLWAGKRDLSLDLPMRVASAPNGVDERLTAEVVEWGATLGVERVSLAFAPFPELFANRHHLSALGKVGYGLVHLLDPLIRVERLYRYLRKFRAFDQERYVMLRWRQVVRVAVALLLLEFGR
ncbi:MAG TPA: phosphatidylglycerol lysyltransferase domain-containing protein [Jatrophihabitans sp.]|nr:phosphatidylglycerol lysyltransferase domain-containing protein [Jatrophihabitans sp.]